MPARSQTDQPVPPDDLTQRKALIENLYIWGPALLQEIRANYPTSLLQEMERNKILARRKFIGFEVYLLSGAGLRPYGYSWRYNYVPSKNIVLGAIIIRALAREYRNNGYEIELYEGYTKRGRDNILLARKDGLLTIVIGRASITMKAARIIINTMKEDVHDIAAIHVIALQDDYEQILLNARSLSGIPFTFLQFPMTRFTREEFKSSKS